MLTLTEFLLARIADEERLAHDAASEGTPHRTGWQWWTSKKDTTPDGEVLGPRGSIEMSPSRALAECEAKRRVVDRYLAQLARQVDPEESQLSADICAEEYADWVIPVLALPYADHPDYDEAWRP